MGMGDPKRPYRPGYGKTRCSVCGNTMHDCAVRCCPHPAVIKRYGVDGNAPVCVYCCRRCKYHIKYQFHGGVGCNYKINDMEGK